jgi:hypothetical protein
MGEFAAAIKLASDTNPVGDPTEFAMYSPDLHEPYEPVGSSAAKTCERPSLLREKTRPHASNSSLVTTNSLRAPAAFSFTIDRAMCPGQWKHLGFFMQTITLVTEEHGLSCCLQEFWMLRHSVVREFQRSR